MIALDVADLVVIAGRVIGIDAETALAQADMCAAQAALVQAHCDEPAPSADRVAVAAAGVRLVRALLRHRPFSQRGEQVAVAAVLQFFSLNGWQANLEPPAEAAVIVEALASGRLSPADAAVWLSLRLSPRHALGPREPRIRVARLTAVGRMLVSAMLAVAVGSLALLATACSQGPGAPAVNQKAHVTVRQSAGPERPAPAPATAGHARPSTRRADPASAHAWFRLPVSSAARPAPGADLGPRVAQVDPADVGGHVEPDQWQPGYRRVKP